MSQSKRKILKEEGEIMERLWNAIVKLSYIVLTIYAVTDPEMTTFMRVCLIVWIGFGFYIYEPKTGEKITA